MPNKLGGKSRNYGKENAQNSKKLQKKENANKNNFKT